MKRLLGLAGLGVLIAALGVFAAVALADPGNGNGNNGTTTTTTEPENGTKVFVCKYVGKPGEDERLQTGNNPIDVSVNAIPNYQGVGSYFADAQGRSYVIGPEHRANEHVTEPTVDKCPRGDNPEDIEITANVTFNEATCDTGASVAYLNMDKVTYAIKSGSVAAGQSVVIEATAKDGYTLGQGTSEFEHAFAAAPTNCGPPPPPHEVTGSAAAICEIGSQLYRVSGTVDGHAADSVSPATVPGHTKGNTEVTVTRGDTSVKTTVSTNGDCGSAPTPPAVTPPVETTAPVQTAPTPPTTTTEPTAPLTPPTTKPVAKKPAVKKAAAKPAPAAPKKAVAGAFAKEPPKLAYTP